ncbi:hypothetical protein BsWGS_15777 [Bradybaena similaris]
MPPKKKGGGKKGKKGKKGKGGKGGKGKKRIDEKALMPVEMMSQPELIDHIEKLREELEREREERNYFQLERDKINTFWEITRRQLNEKMAELRGKERELEEAEEKHQNEVKVYKQKVKHLLFEHQNSLSQMKAENTVNIKTIEDRLSLSVLEIQKDKRALKLGLKAKEFAHDQVIKDLKKRHEDVISALMIDHKRQLHEIETLYLKKMESLREEQDLLHKNAIHEVEERKNKHINTLMRNHESQFADAKNFYNDITLNNIALINSLRDQVEEMKTREARMEKAMKHLEDENHRMAGPLERSKKKLNELKVQLINYNKDKEMLKTKKAHVKALLHEVQNVKWEREILEQALKKTQLEKDELYQKFMVAVHEVQQKCSLRNLLLEKKLSALIATLEKKDSQLNEVLTLSHLDPTKLNIVTRKLEDVLDSKNGAIKDMQYELARISKAHNDLLRTFEAKLQEFGIPIDSLGYMPLENNVRGQRIEEPAV